MRDYFLRSIIKRKECQLMAWLQVVPLEHEFDGLVEGSVELLVVPLLQRPERLHVCDALKGSKVSLYHVGHQQLDVLL